MRESGMIKLFIEDVYLMICLYYVVNIAELWVTGELDRTDCERLEGLE